MARKITKAVIAAAGFGSRFLPITKAIQKEMLPIIDKPILHYTVEECVNSGIKDIIIVTKYGTSTSVENYFDSNVAFEELLKKSKKLDLLEKMKRISRMANIAYVRQKKELPYGNASPLLSAKSFIGNDPFVFAFGDDIVISKVPAIKQVIDIFENNSCEGVLAVKKTPRDQLYRYGVAKLKEGTENELEGIVEKPEPGTEPSDLAEFGRFVFTPKIFDHLGPEMTGKDDELWLIDGIDRLNEEEKFLVCPIKGTWHTTGDPLRFLKTTIDIALKRDDLKDELEAYLRSRVE